MEIGTRTGMKIGVILMTRIGEEIEIKIKMKIRTGIRMRIGIGIVTGIASRQIFLKKKSVNISIKT